MSKKVIRQLGFGRLLDRMARSGQLFLLGLLVACGIEVIVDWNATLSEINVLRNNLRQRGLSYVAILSRAALYPLQSGDQAALAHLCTGLFDDPEVAYARVVDAHGNILYEHLREDFGTAFTKGRGHPFARYYASQIERDQGGVLNDPRGLRDRMAHSRHRDFVQRWNDMVAQLLHPLTELQLQQAAQDARAPRLLYQDRLRMTDGEHDAAATYALGAIAPESEGEQAARAQGVVLVAFDMAKTNAAISRKLLKGCGIILFFVTLILIQNILSRRDKLRLLDAQARNALARQEMRRVMPAPLVLGDFAIAAGLRQAEAMVDGVLWDVHASAEEITLLVIDPEGEGIPAAATALHVVKAFRERRAAGVQETLQGEVAALGEAARTLPLGREVGLLLLRLSPASGVVTGVTGPMGGVRVVGEGVFALEHGAVVAAPEHVLGPLCELSGTVPPGGALCALFSGVGQRDERRTSFADAVADYLLRQRRGGKAEVAELAADTALWARGRASGLSGHDVLIVVALRQARSR